MLCFLLGRRMFQGESLTRGDLQHAIGVMGLLHAPGSRRGEGGEDGALEPEPEPQPEPEPKSQGYASGSRAEAGAEAGAGAGEDGGRGGRWVVGLLERYPETVAVFSAAAPEHFAHPAVM
jgi:hypothetical protein